MTALQLNAEQYRAMGENRETEVRGFRFFVRDPLLSPCLGGGRIKRWKKIKSLLLKIIGKTFDFLDYFL